ncbi:MAG TPA: alpha/beta hydrolase [Acetobacteraceae bacterium]|nr:alpha/beta hydrolase [Acetobacteraceae bacterium]
MSDPEIAALRELIASRPRATDIAQRRRDIDERGRQFGVPRDVTVEKVSANGVPAEWTWTQAADRDRAVLYFHGGGYVIGSLDSHRHVVAEIGRASAARTLAIDYRMAPEHPFPAAVQDALAAYKFLLESGIKPGRICIAGDSAGGGMVVAAMLAIRGENLPQPGCGWCISPWVDLACTGASMQDNAARDPTVQKAGVLDFAGIYLAGGDPRAPLASPVHGDLRGLPPLLIQAGSVETLLDDALMLARVAALADVRVDLQIWPEMIHVWHLFFPMLAAGRRAIAEGGAFVRGHTGEG